MISTNLTVFPKAVVNRSSLKMVLKFSSPTKCVSFGFNLIPQNSKRFSDSEESTNPAVRVTERKL